MARPCPARPRAALLAGVLALASAEGACREGLREGSCAEEEKEAAEAAEASVSLLQTRLKPGPSAAQGQRDLALMHIPFNFGHTVEKVAAFGSGSEAMGEFRQLLAAYGDISGRATAHGKVEEHPIPPGGLAWGHLNPMLQEVSNVTGCPMYYTPQKYWPLGLADRYFGSGNTIFGMLRDPYERLVAFFRGDNAEYGASYPEFFKTCDVNSAVKAMMKTYLAGGAEFANSCTFVPQAEYFDGPHGISQPVDLRQFPASMNEAFREHGYNLTIRSEALRLLRRRRGHLPLAGAHDVPPEGPRLWLPGRPPGPRGLEPERRPRSGSCCSEAWEPTSRPST